ncbi:MAG: histidine kinase dimerization/phospho-acceptor domain-containing protein [Anaerolineae bacterium]
MEPTDKPEEREQFLRWAQLTCAGEVAAMVAHDINNAVTGVMSYTELAQMDLPSWSEAGTYLEKALEQAKRISSLANRLLLISHEAAYTPVREDVRGSLEAACVLVRRRLEKDGIAFEQRLNIADACVRADTARLLLTWLGLILVARSALLQSPAESSRALRLGAETTSRDGLPCARVVVDAGADAPPPARFVETLCRAETDGAPACREAMLYATAKAHIADLGGSLSLRQTDGGFAFDVELPLTA